MQGSGSGLPVAERPDSRGTRPQSGNINRHDAFSRGIDGSPTSLEGFAELFIRQTSVADDVPHRDGVDRVMPRDRQHP